MSEPKLIAAVLRLQEWQQHTTQLEQRLDELLQTAVTLTGLHASDMAVWSQQKESRAQDSGAWLYGVAALLARRMIATGGLRTFPWCQDTAHELKIIGSMLRNMQHPACQKGWLITFKGTG